MEHGERGKEGRDTFEKQVRHEPEEPWVAVILAVYGTLSLPFHR